MLALGTSSDRNRPNVWTLLKRVERLRSARRPEHVRVVLLAESHVWTSRDETRNPMDKSYAAIRDELVMTLAAGGIPLPAIVLLFRRQS
jgi:hypothetical protein